MALGHLQSGTVEAVLIFFAAGWIIYEAAHKLLAPQPIEAVGWGVGVMLVSSVMNMIVSHRLSKLGKETDSIALQADAWYLRTDVYTSAGVMRRKELPSCLKKGSSWSPDRHAGSGPHW